MSRTVGLPGAALACSALELDELDQNGKTTEPNIVAIRCGPIGRKTPRGDTTDWSMLRSRI